MHTDATGAVDLGQVKSTMHSLAFGEAMAQAAEDYKRVSWDLLESAAARSQGCAATCCSQLVTSFVELPLYTAAS